MVYEMSQLGSRPRVDPIRAPRPLSNVHPMKPVVVSDVLAVGEFPTPDQLAILAKAGFKAILNNQPDGEVSRFQSAASVEAEAKRLGLGYAYAPLSSRTPPRDQLALYAAALAALPSPIYAFCYSGARSAAGCALLLSGSMEVDAIVKEFDEAGFDLEGIRPWLDDEHASAAAAPGGSQPQPAKEAAVEAGAAAPVALPVLAAASSGADTPARPKTPTVLPRMIIVQPRAAGYGGYAV